MEIVYTRNPRLPKLAWLADLNFVTKALFVEHGSCVECREHFFIEGAWNGPFENGEFSTTDCIFGTGAVVFEESIVFVSSACTTDYLYYQQKSDGQVRVANSLPLLLASLKDALNPSVTSYNRINDSIREGIVNYIQEIPTVKGFVRRLMYRNLSIDTAGIREVDKAMPPSFDCYEDYYSYLAKNYQLLIENVRDPKRTTKVEVCSTQSKGYDTTAVNAIAAKFGIDKVFTIQKGKNVSYFATDDENVQVDDDGSEICKVLGLTGIPIERRAFANNFSKEYFYHAALHRNQDSNLMEIEKHISGVSILLTGNLGEIWGTSSSYRERPGYINSELKRFDLGGHGLSEVRLVVGFIQVPFVYVGARRREEIMRITESKEMSSWRLENNYDRPIARRISEDVGVPREAFGQVKIASVVLFPMPSLPYGKELRDEFLEFVVNEKLLTRWMNQFWPVVHFVNTAISFKHSRYKGLYYLERIISRVIGNKWQLKYVWRHLDSALYCFCVNKCAREYEGYLSEVTMSEPVDKAPM